MKTLTLLLALCISASIINASDLSVSLTIVPRASYPIQELFDMIENRESSDSIANISVVNSSSTDYQLKARVQIFTATLGSEPIFDYVTNYSAFPIDVDANSVFNISNTSVKEDMLSSGLTVGSTDGLTDRIIDAYGEDILAKTAGLFPEDKYSYRIYIFDKDESNDNVINLENVLASTEESIYIPLEFGNIDIIYPEDGDIIPNTNDYPTFFWSAVSIRSAVDVIYKFKLWKVINSDVESSISGIPILEEEIINSSQLTYPSYAEAFITGQQYAWRIDAYDEAGYLIGINGSSDVNTFTFGDNTAPDLVQDHIDINNFPSQLSWTYDDPNATFTIIISEYSSLKRPIIQEQVIGSSYSLDDATDFTPGKTYYWAVALNEGEDNELVSSVSTFKVDLDITLIYPLDTSLNPTNLTFYWNASELNRYRLDLTTSKRFTNFDTFIVEGTRLTLDSSSFDFEAGESYYWRVAMLDKYGELSTDFSDEGQFSIDELSDVQLIYPVQDMIEQSPFQFIFQEADWASSYSLSITDKRGKKKLFQETIDGSPYQLDLSLVETLSNYSHYQWQIEAIGDKESEQKISELAPFSIRIQEDIQLISYPQNSSSLSDILWQKHSLASYYKILLSESSNFDHASTYRTSKTNFELPSDLDQQQPWYFKVQAFDKRNDVLAESAVKVIESNASSTPSIAYISPISNVAVESDWHFKWISQSNNVVVELSQNKRFVNSRKFKVNGHSLKGSDIDYDFATDRSYYWRLAGDDNYATFSLSSNLLKLLYPISAQIESSPIQFQWLGTEGAYYRLVIADNPELSPSLTYDTRSTTYQLTLLENKRYYWRVDQLKANGMLDRHSDVSTFVLNSTIQSLQDNTIKELNYFIKQQLDAESPLLDSSWEIETVESKDGDRVSDRDIQHLLKNPNSLIKLVE